ncbi:MAG: RES family NAD+ phosphorylase [Bacteroidota bacterium]|nr:RES family NAD+ phosphorylase [Bacteroidota bacterium]
MIVFRLSKGKYKDELSGYGASLAGQRWNSKGTEVVYASQSRALANSEVAVHISLGNLPKDYHMVEIEIDDSVEIYEVQISSLPVNWNSIPPIPATQHIGDQFVNDNKNAVIKVPSVVVRGEFNIILNPKHKDFKKIKIIRTEPFPIDPRYTIAR